MKRIEKRIGLLEESILKNSKKVLYLNDWRDVIAYDNLIRKGEHKDYKVYVAKKVEPLMYIVYLPE